MIRLISYNEKELLVFSYHSRWYIFIEQMLTCLHGIENDVIQNDKVNNASLCNIENDNTIDQFCQQLCDSMKDFKQIDQTAKSSKIESVLYNALPMVCGHLRCHSHKHILINGNWVNEQEHTLLQFLQTNSQMLAKTKTLTAVNCSFYVRYSNEMRRRWSVRCQKAQQTHTDFCDTYLNRVLPVWAHLYRNMQLVDQMEDFCSKNEAFVDRDKQTDDLLEHLSRLSQTNSASVSRHFKSSKKDYTNRCSTISPYFQTAKSDKPQMVAKTTEKICAKPLLPTCLPDESQHVSNTHNDAGKELQLYQRSQTLSKIDTKPRAIIDRQQQPQTKKRRRRRRRRTLTHRDRLAVAAEQQFCCGWCQQRLNETFEVDHLEEFHETGNDHFENLTAFCPNCHAKKTELDRRRKKPAIWHGFYNQTPQEKEQVRQAKLRKIMKF